MKYLAELVWLSTTAFDELTIFQFVSTKDFSVGTSVHTATL